MMSDEMKMMFVVMVHLQACRYPSEESGGGGLIALLGI